MKLNTTSLLLTTKPNLLFFMRTQNCDLLRTSFNINLIKTALNYTSLNSWFKNTIKPLKSLNSTKLLKKSYQLSKSLSKCYLTPQKSYNLSLCFIRSNSNRSVRVLNYGKLSPTTLKLLNCFSKSFLSFFVQSKIQWTYLFTYLQLISPQNTLQLILPYHTNNILSYKNLFTLNLSNL